MTYKDKDKQKEATRLRQQRRRDAIKVKGVTNEGVTQGVTVPVGEGPVTSPFRDDIGPISEQPKCWCCGNDIPVGTVCCGPCAWPGKAKAKREAGEGLRVMTEADFKTMPLVTVVDAPFNRIAAGVVPDSRT